MHARGRFRPREAEPAELVSLCRHKLSSRQSLLVLLGLVMFSNALAADTIEGAVFRDDDANGVQTEAEAGAEGVRILAHSGSQILAPAPKPPSNVVTKTVKDVGDDFAKAHEETKSGKPRPNVRKPKPFANDGRGSTPKLPEYDADVKSDILSRTYSDPRQPGKSLDGKRIWVAATVEFELLWITS